MVVITRSRGKNSSDPEEDQSSKKRRSSSKKKVVIEFTPRTTRRSSSDNDSSDSEDEEEVDDDFELPYEILNDPKLHKKADKVIQHIRKSERTLSDVLNAKIRMKHKAELFELCLIYQQMMPMTEERMMLRKEIDHAFRMFSKEYDKFKQHKPAILQMEESIDQLDDVTEMQYRILGLEASDKVKQTLFTKYCELRNQPDKDEEYMKLKSWLQQALDLPFDRIKTVQYHDDITCALQKMYDYLNSQLYGMEIVKEQLLLFIHNKMRNPSLRGCCLGLVGPPGVGKCLDPNTLLWMADDSYKRVCDLVVGDLLMGDDGTSRTVLSMTTGVEDMYEIEHQDGTTYRVNKSHILTVFVHYKLFDIPLETIINNPSLYMGVKINKNDFSFVHVPIRSIRNVGTDTYMGFELNGNGRFLLHDGTITHNTTIARSLAHVMDIPFEQINFGGVHQADFIKGHDYTYVGSKPGEIAKCLIRMKYKNGILFFDEYEKVSDQPEILSTLLHITDFSQNNQFRDNFFHDLTLDLSCLWFIYSMNALPLDSALRDRIYSINVPGYKEKEKVRIIVDYLLPKHLLNLKLCREDICLPEESAVYLVRKLTKSESGIRKLEHAMKNLVDKILFLHANQDQLRVSFSLPLSYYPIIFPISIDIKMIDILLKDFSPEESNHQSMFL